MSAAKVLVVGEHPFIRAGVRESLRAAPEASVIAEAGGCEEAVKACGQRKPEVVIVDVSDGEGAADGRTVRQVRKAWPQAAVVALAVPQDSALLRELAAAGVAGYLLKSEPPERLREAIGAVRRGETFMSNGLAQALLAERFERVRQGDGDRALSARERQVLVLLAHGLPNRRIAEKLGVSVRTVETHRANLKQKLGLASVAQLTRFAVSRGLVEPEGA